jgi:hypothetical protein
LRLALHPDGDGIWGYCQENGFCGDFFDILCRHFNVQTLEQLLWRMEETGCIAERQRIPNTTIAEYELNRSHRIAFMKFWKACQTR